MVADRKLVNPDVRPEGQEPAPNRHVFREKRFKQQQAATFS